MINEIHGCEQSKILTKSGDSSLRKRCEMGTSLRPENCCDCSNYFNIPLSKLPDYTEKYGYKTVR